MVGINVSGKYSASIYRIKFSRRGMKQEYAGRFQEICPMRSSDRQHKNTAWEVEVRTGSA